jgi:hypothetical protein
MQTSQPYGENVPVDIGGVVVVVTVQWNGNGTREKESRQVAGYVYATVPCPVDVQEDNLSNFYPIAYTLSVSGSRLGSFRRHMIAQYALGGSCVPCMSTGPTLAFSRSP